jgi:preprotein translocase subunit SecY
MLLKKIFYTLLVLSLIRIGNFIPIPGVNQTYLYNALKDSSVLSLFNTFSQGKLFILGIFSLGILPNINASIIMQIFVAVLPNLKKLQQEEGESGRKKITQYTRYLTLFIALIYSVGIVSFLKPFIFGYNLGRIIEITLTLVTGSIIIMWLSELITEIGIGNGSSLIIFINIISSVPLTISSLFSPSGSYFDKISILILIALSIFGVIFIQKLTKIIPLLSTKELFNNSQTQNESGTQSYIPFRLNQSGILPIIFATTFLTIPFNILGNFPILKSFISSNFGNFIYTTLYFVLIIFFNLFYSGFILNSSELARDLNKMGFIIPNFRPGIQTQNYILQTTNRLGILGGLFLAIIATLPNFIRYFNNDNGLLRNFGATSLIILVGVAIDLYKKIRSFLISNYYKDYYKKIS